MKKIRIALVVMTLLFAGCRGPHIGDKNGWGDEQKREFEEILSSDRYASLCNLTPLYQEYLQSGDTAVLSKLLVGYSVNLANSCIDIEHFREEMRKREEKKIKSHYQISLQNISSAEIISKLRDGYTIKEILNSYKPANPYFYILTRRYLRYRHGGLSAENLRKLKLNIERTKIMNDEGWGDRFMLVNIPEYTFRLIEHNRSVMKFPVVVGRKKWQTPVFDSTMKYIVLNPNWNVPDNIARDEEIPKIIRNPFYLKKKNMLVYRNCDDDSKPINPRKVPWRKLLGKEYKKRNLPYKIVELPSEKNALGKVKFIFPNEYSVYMHDTPSKHLFRHKFRAYSHGCIRLSKPIELLERLSDSNLTLERKSIAEIFESKKMRYTTLKEYIPVHIVYLSAFVEEDGSLKFFHDIYGFDTIQRLRGEEQDGTEGL
jgi:hypothetical protein